MKLLLCISLLLSIYLHEGGCDLLNVTSSRYQIKQANVLAGTINLVEFDFFFDEKLYLLDSFRCPLPFDSNSTICSNGPNVDPQDLSPSSCACDYASKDTCGTPLSVTPGCTCDQSFCEIEDWITLEDDVMRQDEVQAGFLNKYRFNSHKSCQTYRVTVTAIYGDPDLYVSFDEPVNDRDFTFRGLKVGGEEVTVCPTHPGYSIGNAGYGTVFFGVFGYRASLYNITMEAFDYIEVPPDTNTCNLPTLLKHGSELNATCIIGEESYSKPDEDFPNGMLKYYTLEVPNDKCSPVSFSLISFTGDFNLFVTDDINTDDYANVYGWPWGAKNSGYEDTLTFIYCPQKPQFEGTRSNFLLVSVYAYTGGSFSFRATVKPDLLKKSLTSFSPSQGAYSLSGSTYMRCPDILFQCTAWFDCDNLYMTYPAVETRSFWPLPYLFENTRDFVEVANFQTTFQPVPAENKLTGVLITSYSIDNFRGDYFNPNNTEECKMYFLGTVVDEYLNPINPLPQSVGKKYTPECNYTTFVAQKVLVDKLIEDLGEITDPNSLVNANFEIDTTTVNDAYLGCSYLIQSLIKKDVEDKLVVGTQGCFASEYSQEYMDDPCCNHSLSFLENCLPRNQTVRTIVLLEPDTELVDSTCLSPSCVGTTLTEFKINQDFITNPTTGCASILSVSTASRLSYFRQVTTPFEDCMKSNFNNFGYRIDIDNQEENFLKCFVNNTAPSIVTFIKDKFNLTDDESSPNFITSFWNVLASYDCVNPYDLDLFHRSHWELVSTELGCTDSCGIQACVDPGCSLPFNCDMISYQYMGGFCERVWASVSPSQTQCLTNNVKCNWNCSAGNETCTKTNCTSVDNICGLCQDPERFDCPHNFPQYDNQFSCESTPSCLLPDGTVRFGLTQSQCESIGECTIEGKNQASITDRNTCLMSGSCSDAEHFPKDEFCIFKLSELESGGFQLVYCTNGPVSYPWGCPDYNITKDNCNAEGGLWYKLGTDRASCLSYLGCYEDVFKFVSLTPKTPEMCEEVHGVVMSHFEWTPGVWTTGKYQNLQWIETKYTSMYSWKQTLNLSMLFDAVIEAAASDYSFLLRTNLLCKYNKIFNLINKISCDCTDTEGCFDTHEEVQIGVTSVCLGVELSVKAPPALLVFSNESVSNGDNSLKSQDSYCLDVTFRLTPASDYTSTRVLTFTSEAFNSVNEYASISNEHGATIGQLVGDGVQINYKSALPRLDISSFEICVDWRANIRADLELYPVNDFAYLDGSSLKPFGIVASLNSTGRTCAALSSSNHFENGIWIFPIRRIHNFSDLKPFELTVSEKAVYYLVGALYSLVALYEVVNLIGFTFFNREMSRKGLLPKRGLLGLFVTQNLIRAFYYFISPHGIIPNDSILLVILSELPTFIFFSAFSIVVCVWAMIAHDKLRSTTMQSIGIFKRIGVASNLFSYIVFIILCILCEVLPNKTYEEQQVCGNTERKSIPTTKTSRWAIVVTYKFFIFALGLLLAILFTIYSYLVFKRVSELSTRIVSYERRLFLIGTVATLSFVLHTVLFIIQSFKNNYIAIAIVLVILELVPQMFIVYTSARHKLASSGSRSTSNGSNSHHSSKSADIKMGISRAASKSTLIDVSSAKDDDIDLKELHSNINYMNSEDTPMSKGDIESDEEVNLP